MSQWDDLIMEHYVWFVGHVYLWGVIGLPICWGLWWTFLSPDLHEDILDTSFMTTIIVAIFWPIIILMAVVAIPCLLLGVGCWSFREWRLHR